MSELQNQILNLSISERIQLIAFIASSISKEDVEKEFDIPEAWVEEALERNARLKSGESKGLSWEEVKAHLDARK